MPATSIVGWKMYKTVSLSLQSNKLSLKQKWCKAIKQIYFSNRETTLLIYINKYIRAGNKIKVIGKDFVGRPETGHSPFKTLTMP